MATVRAVGGGAIEWDARRRPAESGAAGRPVCRAGWKRASNARYQRAADGGALIP
jgi:hypothetical protein